MEENKRNKKEKNSQNSFLDSFKSIIEKENITDILSELLKPGGLCDRFACQNRNKIKMNQLRKFFSEFKKIIKKANNTSKKDNSDYEKEIYKLFPIIAYNEGRGLIPKPFAEMLSLILEKITENKDDEKKRLFYLKILDAFLTGLIGYMKKYNPKA